MKKEKAQRIQKRVQIIRIVLIFIMLTLLFFAFYCSTPTTVQPPATATVDSAL